MDSAEVEVFIEGILESCRGFIVLVHIKNDRFRVCQSVGRVLGRSLVRQDHASIKELFLLFLLDCNKYDILATSEVFDSYR
jgi:hypothetical protein